MIDEKKLIEGIEVEVQAIEEKDEKGEKYYKGKAAGLRTAEALAKLLPKTGEWIPCSERLPEWGTTSYLVCLKNGGVFMAILLNDGEFEEISSLGTREFSKDNPVIAWQPLPAPYEVKSDE